MKKLSLLFIGFALIFAACTPIETSLAPTATSLPLIISTPNLFLTATPTPAPSHTPPGTPLLAWNTLTTFHAFEKPQIWDDFLYRDMEIWAIGKPGILLHQNRPFSQQELLPDSIGKGSLTDSNTPTAIFFISVEDGWLAANGGQIYHWDGQRWANSLPYQSSDLVWYELGFAGKDLGWAVGCKHTFENDRARIQRWNGASWVEEILPEDIPLDLCLKDISVVAADDAWAVGGDTINSLLLHWDGSAWHQVPLPAEITLACAVGALSPNDAWVVDLNGVHYWNGKDWQSTPLPVYYAVDSNEFAGPVVYASSSKWSGDSIRVGGRTLYCSQNGEPWKEIPLPFEQDYIVDIQKGMILTLSGKIYIDY